MISGEIRSGADAKVSYPEHSTPIPGAQLASALDNLGYITEELYAQVNELYRRLYGPTAEKIEKDLPRITSDGYINKATGLIEINTDKLRLVSSRLSQMIESLP